MTTYKSSLPQGQYPRVSKGPDVTISRVYSNLGRGGNTQLPSLQDPAGLLKPSWKQEPGRTPRLVHRVQPPAAESKRMGGSGSGGITQYLPSPINGESRPQAALSQEILFPFCFAFIVFIVSVYYDR